MIKILLEEFGNVYFLAQLLLTILLGIIAASFEFNTILHYLVRLLPLFSSYQMIQKVLKILRKLDRPLKQKYDNLWENQALANQFLSKQQSITPTRKFTNQRNLNLNSLKENSSSNFPQPYLGDYTQSVNYTQNFSQFITQESQFNKVGKQNTFGPNFSLQRTFIQEEQKDFKRDRPSSLPVSRQLPRIVEQEEIDPAQDDYLENQSSRGPQNKGQLLQKIKLNFDRQKQSQFSEPDYFLKPSTNKLDLRTIGSYTPSRIVSQSANTFRETKGDYYSTKLGNEELRLLYEKYLPTETLIQREFGIKFTDLEQHSKKWILKKLIPNFLNSLEQLLKSINLILIEYFDRQIRELDLFMNTPPPDRGSPLVQVSIDQVLQLLQSLELNKTWIWVPVDIQKFEQEESNKLIKYLVELRLFEKILNVRNDRKCFGAQLRSNIINRLITIFDEQTIEFNQELRNSTPTDTEIISSLIMNVINYSIEYEKLMITWRDPTLTNQPQQIVYLIFNLTFEQKRDELKVKLQIIQDLFTPTQIWCVRSDHMTIPIPKSVKYEELIERNQLTQAYWISQKFQSFHEPAYQFYSDILYTKINEKQEILYTHIGEKQLYGSLGFYFLHLLCLPKSHMQKLLQFEYRQKLLSEVFDGALEIKYKTRL